uniref:ATP synthase protein 8 n=2 Tax=Paracentrotus TaxID=7655 RepID=ATP8_PARLI|nr:ATP synthase F0 subunit 8 [Paracentrotus lividus]P12697.1 RecName: Full=ATP synthase protein 8; AltName: Full=A6L; AltName: Full=F-ATPase subunit 8 [Paracentrotus lividus]AAA68138.1 FO-ATPase subunit 8 [Paracentrotus lividus]ADA70950.1 F0-ATPase region 8 [Paracentrotus gaimardi]
MPQLDFTWWIINFFIIWTAILLTLVILVNNKTAQNLTTTDSLQIEKNSTNWQWL